MMAEHEPVPEMVGTGGSSKPTGRSQCAKGLQIWPCEVARLRKLVAVAWQEGYTSGHSRAMRKMSDEPDVEPAPNPYASWAEQ